MTMRGFCRHPRRVIALVGLVVASWHATCGAAVVTDGTLGRAGPVTPVNNIYAITPALGQTRGPNLFHSFSQFDLAQGETASFTGPPTIKNVLARVTGGTASDIHGTIQCTIPNATFYLMNPAGVVFGPDAKLDVNGSFAVTTADYIRLGASQKFGPPGPADSALTTAPPAAFGFFGHRAGIDIAGGLAVPQGRVLSLIGGDVRINGGQVVAPSGRVNITSAASVGEARFDASSPASTPDLSTVGRRGLVELTASAAVDVNGQQAGTIYIAAGLLHIESRPEVFEDYSCLSADSSGDVPGGRIIVDVTGPAVFRAAALTATSDGGAGGAVSVRASQIEFVGVDSTSDAYAVPTTVVTDGESIIRGGGISLAASIIDATGPVIFSAAGPPTGSLIRISGSLTQNGSPGSLVADGMGGAQILADSAGKIATDGTLGPATVLAGPAYSVPASLGRQVGGNLFQSLSHFDLVPDESVTFSGPATVSNVLVRVTGDSAARINGALHCTISGANLFLLDPAGMVFGPNAKLDISGSFTAGTADYFQLGTSGRFSASAPSSDSLASAAPAAFGLTGAAGEMLVRDNLLVPSGQAVSLLAGDLLISQSGNATAPGGAVSLVATRSVGQVPLGFGNLVAASALTASGTIDFIDSGIGTSGDSGGRIAIRAADLILTGSTGVNAETTGAGPGGVIDLRVSELDINSDPS